MCFAQKADLRKKKKKWKCEIAFEEIGLSILPSLYILDVTLYCRFKWEVVQVSRVHKYKTRGRDNFRTEKRKTIILGHLPSQIGVKIINKILRDLQRINEPKQFKSR
ncbi:hypothetical protein J6590_070655 [Homalodisca vitripennis]|nr:hypothetical protein J6590_070655 [Homalodisca vitripennis]